MAHKTDKELWSEIEKAKQDIRLDERYFHYKHPEKQYTVVGLVVIEETDSIGVLYRAEYAAVQGIVFVRPIESFLAEIDTDDGKKMKRFTLIINNHK